MPKQDAKKAFIFDLDDTLMWNEYTYSLAFIEFYEYLRKLWDNRIPYIGSVAKRGEEITHDMVIQINPDTGKPYGFTMERFPTSLVRTYKELCDKNFGVFDDAIASNVYKIGLKFCAQHNYVEQGLVNGAQDVLYFLKQQKCPLFLVTKGDSRVQQIKIDALKFKPWFVEIAIVDNKTPETFLEYVRRFSGHKIWSVGNSFYSDIQPAIQAGCGGIYIPCYTWKIEELPEDYDKATVITVQTILELPNLYESGRLD